MRPDRSLPPPPTERQLALPLAAVAASAAPVGLGPGIPPRRVWRTLAPQARASVRQALRRICLEVVHDAAAER